MREFADRLAAWLVPAKDTAEVTVDLRDLREALRAAAEPKRQTDDVRQARVSEGHRLLALAEESLCQLREETHEALGDSVDSIGPVGKNLWLAPRLFAERGGSSDWGEAVSFVIACPGLEVHLGCGVRVLAPDDVEISVGYATLAGSPNIEWRRAAAFALGSAQAENGVAELLSELRKATPDTVRLLIARLGGRR
jgi:hypothetical protein